MSIPNIGKVSIESSSCSTGSNRGGSPKSPQAKHISTISNDLRIGRSPNYISSSTNVRNNRSPNFNNRRYSHNDVDSQTSRLENSKLNNEQIIDLMEREQDGIVLKLMKEIASLKEENRQLKANMNSIHSTKRTSSLSSNRSSVSSTSSASYVATPTLAKSNSSKTLFNIDCFEKNEPLNSDSRKKIKRKYSNEMPPPENLTPRYDTLEDPNQILKNENEALKTELKMLRSRLH